MLIYVYIPANDKTLRICIQGTDKLTPKIWTFDDGTRMTYFNWDEERGQPGGKGGNVEMYIGYKWHDLADVKTEGCLPICERNNAIVKV